MIAATVGFDDQACDTPEEVGHCATTTRVERHIDLWTRQSSLLAHPEKSDLHFASRPLHLRMDFVHHHSQARHPTPAPAALDQPSNGAVVEDSQHLRLGDSLPQFPDRRDRREVQQGAGHARTRDAVQFGPVGWSQRPVPMRIDPLGNAPPPIRRCHINRSVLVLSQPPQGRRRSVRQHRPRSTSKHRRQASAVTRQPRLTNSEDSLVNPKKPARRNPAAGGVLADPYDPKLLE